jgi:hypothetical protein
MGGPIVVTPKEKEKKKIESVEFKTGGKTYVAKFDNPPKIGEVNMPKGKGKKEIDASFAEMAKDYKVKIYAVDKAGKETLLKNPNQKMLSQAGKALLRKSVVYSSVLKKV